MSTPNLARNCSILLVDDEEMVLRLLSTMLEAAGYKVLPATNGHDALAVLSEASNPVDLLVTDVNLPGMTGIELAASASRDGVSPAVLLISGLPLPPDVKAPEWHYLPKPFAPHRFVETVNGILSRSGR